LNDLIYDAYNTPEGKKYVQCTLQEFSKIISILENEYNIKPFNQQTAQSLTELYLLVKVIKPATVFELGCGTRSSTIALAMALTEGCIHGVDLSPTNFKALMNKNFPCIKCAPVIDHALNALDFEIPEDWKRPIFTLYDAHDNDIPGVKIFPHAEEKWFPKLKGSIIAMHDCSIGDSKVNYPLDGDHFSCRHFSGRYVSGFFEVIALTEWMNENSINFYRPGDDMKRLGFDGHNSSLICFEVL
jgi:hypothetical protein